MFHEIATVLAALISIGIAGAYSGKLRSKAMLAANELKIAKELVQDITSAFSSRLRNLSGSIEAVHSEVLYLQQRLKHLEQPSHKEDPGYQEFVALLETTAKSQTVTVQKLGQLGIRVKNLAVDTEALKTQIRGFDLQRKTPSPEPEGTASLPVDAQASLGRLTDTELKILGLLAAEGPKPAPELKVSIGKTREHTARLMNTLFKEGFVERDTSTLPYKYKVREELKKALQGHPSNSQFLQR